LFIFHKHTLCERERVTEREQASLDAIKKSSQKMLGQLLLCWCAAGNMQSSLTISLPMSLSYFCVVTWNVLLFVIIYFKCDWDGDR